MKSGLLSWFLLAVLIFQPVAIASGPNSKEFIPGVSLDLNMKNKTNWNVPLTASYFVPEINGKAELIKNFGPNREEALRLSMKKEKPFIVEVRYFPNLEVGFRYRLSVEYKADYETEHDEEVGAFLLLLSHKSISDNTFIPLKNTSKWTKIEAEFDLLNTSSSTPFCIYFCLGSLMPSFVFSSGEVCFINLEIEKMEDLRDGLWYFY